MSETATDDVTRRRLIMLLAASLSLVALVQVAWTVLSRASYDWDLEAFLYLGSRLAEGELLYTHDFETKLPLVQYIFYWPWLLGGIGAWKLLNFGLATICGFFASSQLVNALSATVERGVGARHMTWYLTSLYLVILYSLPGAESGQLEMVSGSLAYLACAWLVASGRRPIGTHGKLAVASGFLVGLASLIRPNYVYLAVAILAWMSSSFAGWRSIRPVVSRTAAFVAGFGLAIAAAFLPYVVSGPASLAALADGLRAIGTFSSGMSLEALVRAQFASLGTGSFYVFLYLGLLVGLVQSLGHRDQEPGNGRVEFEMHLLALLGALSLIASVLRNHYWAHNAMLFVPFVAMVALCHSDRLFDWVTNRVRGPGTSPRHARKVGLATVVGLSLVVLGAVIH